MVVFVSLALSSIWGFLSLYHRFPNKLLGILFHQCGVQAGHSILEEGSIRRLLLALSSTAPRYDTATTSGLRGSQAETGGNGQESTSLAVHRRFVLPAAMAGVSCRYRCARRLPPRTRGCTSATRSDS